MIDLESLKNVRLLGGFRIVAIVATKEPLTDALEREAIAQTRINASNFSITMREGLSERELSVTLYHEVLEAATVASPAPPLAVIEFNEGDFERAAQEAFTRFGEATLPNLNSMLQSFGFHGK